MVLGGVCETRPQKVAKNDGTESRFELCLGEVWCGWVMVFLRVGRFRNSVFIYVIKGLRWLRN